MGFVVLGFGVLAVTATLLLALNMRDTGISENSSEVREDKPSEAAADENMVDTLKSMTQETREPSEPAPKVNVSRERQENIKESAITGMWQTQIDGGKAVLQIENNVYRIIISFENPNLSRRYSNGTYRLIKDILVFYPNPAWGAPEVPEGSPSIDYDALTQSEFPILVSRQRNNLVFIHPDDEMVPSGVYRPSDSPLLSLIETGIAVWEPLR
jgi:hypothetical protein